MKMKLTMRLFGILIASVALVACGGGSGGKPVKTEKVWRLVEKVERGLVRTFEYDGNGLLVKQDHGSQGYFDFVYDNQGVLLKKEEFSSKGVILSRVEFDEYGEAISRYLGFLFKLQYSFENKYPDDMVVNKKEIQEIVLRKIIQTKRRLAIRIVPGSKLVSRRAKKERVLERIEKFKYEGNEIHYEYFNIPDDEEADETGIIYYNKYGESLGDNRYTYDYTEDEHGNLIKKVQQPSGDTTTYTWKQMDIPIE